MQQLTLLAKNTNQQSSTVRKYTMFALLASAFLLFFSLGYSQNTSEGNNQKRDVAGFTGISLDIHADMSISQDNNFFVEIQAKPEVLEQIITEKKGSDLVIRYKDNKWHQPAENNVKITIRLPKLNSLEINGSGNVVALSDFSTDKLDIEINGSGDLKMKGISASSVSAEVNGSGDIGQLSGSAEEIDLEVNGSGGIDAGGLTAKTASVSIAGSGDVSMGTISDLNVEIAGSGDVSYKGNPSSIKKDIVGSGKISQR